MTNTEFLATAPRNIRILGSYAHRAAAELDAAAKNARTEAEAEHATRGRQLCIELFNRIWK